MAPIWCKIVVSTLVRTFMLNQNGSNDLSNEKTVVIKEQIVPSIDLQKTLDISDIVTDVPLSKRTAVEVDEWRARENEKTRSHLTNALIWLFGVTLLYSLTLTAISAFNKDADKNVIQSQIALAINATTALLSSAMGYYFGTQKNK